MKLFSTRRSRNGSPAARKARLGRTTRPLLEVLEDRSLLSVSLTALASFNGTNGASPYGAVIMDSSGNLYGTTQGGGAYGDGTVFELAKGSSSITTLASFNGTNGAGPWDGVIVDSSGNLYGTTYAGGASNAGTVFELAQGSNTIATLASFNGTNGSSVKGGVVMDSSGNLYGVTGAGVFEVAKGSGRITVLAPLNSSTGSNPRAGLIMDSSGNLYGTTSYYHGTIFELAKGSSTLTALAGFNQNSGFDPFDGVLMDSSGNLYGTAFLGGDNHSDGTVFELAKGSSTITLAAAFNGSNGGGTNPTAGLIMDSSGNLYGTTHDGGAYNGSNGGDGTVFELANGSSTITTLASFNGTDGASPWAGVIMDSSGNMYTTTTGGGAYGDGTIVEVSFGPSFAITGPTTSTAGTTGTFTITALNTDGTPNTGYSGTVQITSSDGKAVLPGNVAITGGTGTFNVTLETAGTQSVTATDVNNPGITGGDTGIAVTPAAASQVLFTQGPSSGTAGQTLGTVEVAIEDVYGNIETGDNSDQVTLSVSSGPSTQLGGTLTETVQAGNAIFSNLLLDTSGSYTLAALANLAGGGTLGPVVSSGFAVASPVSTQFGSITYNSRTGLYSETVTLTNTTSGPLTGPMSLELTNLPSGVVLTDATGTTNGNPYIRFLNSGKTLRKGASVSMTLTFTAASAGEITFGTEVVVGL